MPRKSAEALSAEIWRTRNAPPPPPHPEPPEWLSPAAARHWREIVHSRPPDYFDAPNRILLECLCNSMATADMIWADVHQLDQSDPKQFRRYRSLLVMAARESRMMTMLMTKLRLLPTKHMAEQTAQPPQPSRPPWERHI